MTDVRNLLAALDTFEGHWQPHRVASLNDADVKVVKVLGEFVWHTHPETDELFLVLDGELTIDLRDGGVERAVVLRPHDLFVVPRGVEHRPRRRRDLRGARRASGDGQHGRRGRGPHVAAAGAAGRAADRVTAAAGSTRAGEIDPRRVDRAPPGPVSEGQTRTTTLPRTCPDWLTRCASAASARSKTSAISGRSRPSSPSRASSARSAASGRTHT